jgi:hypothetical protein
MTYPTMTTQELAQALLALPNVPVWVHVEGVKLVPVRNVQAYGPDVCAGIPEQILIIETIPLAH